MNRRTALTLVSLMLLLALTTVSHAATIMYDNRAAWEAAVPAWADVDLTRYAEFDTVTTVLLPLLAAPATKIDFDVTLTAYQVGSVWVPAAGDAWAVTTPRILYSGDGVTSATGTFDSPLLGFGFEMDPNSYGAFDMTLSLDSSETLTQTVDPNHGGAKFFGFWGSTGVASWTASFSDPTGGFAMGRMVVAGPGDDHDGSPELSTWMLLACSGLAGLVIRRRRRS